MPTLSLAAGMSEHAWEDLIAGDRMRVDREFAPNVAQSGFSRSEWGMIMTAVRFEIEGEGEDARLVANTEKIDAILPELDKIVKQMGGSPPGRGGSGLAELLGAGDGPGLLGQVKASLGMGNGVDPKRRREAIELAEAYAQKLQMHLEEHGRWEHIRELAADQDGTESAEEA